MKKPSIFRRKDDLVETPETQPSVQPSVTPISTPIDSRPDTIKPRGRSRGHTGTPNKLPALRLSMLLGVAASLVVMQTILAMSVIGFDRLFIMLSGVLIVTLAAAWYNLDSRKSAADKDLFERNQRLAQRLESLEDHSWEVRESEEIHRSLAEAFGDVVIHRDAHGAIMFTNSPFDTYFDDNYALPEPLNPVDVSKVLENKLVGDPRTREIEILTRAGKRWFSWTDLTIRDGQTGDTGSRSVARDITDRKKNEMALVDAVKKAESASQAKSRFLAMVSHEVRTPLNGVIGMTRLLMDTKLDPTQKSYVEAVSTSGGTLLGLIEDLLDSATIEAGQIALQPKRTSLKNIVEDVSEILAPRARDKGLAIATFLDPALSDSIMIDPIRLRQVLLNLTGNAVKFTESGGVSIEVSHTGQKDGLQTLEFQIIDSGPGLSEREQARIFEEFAQADSTSTRRHEGAGLGLFISKRIIELMGGEISVKSRAGRGSIFLFTITVPSEPGQLGDQDTTVEGQTLALIMPGSPARRAIVRSAASLGFNVASYDSLQAFESRPPTEGDQTALIIDRKTIVEDNYDWATFKNHVGGVSRVLLLGNTQDRHGDEDKAALHSDGWLTWPIRRHTLDKILTVTLGSTDNNTPKLENKEPEAPKFRKQKQSARILLAEDNAINAMMGMALLGKLGYRAKRVENGLEALEALSNARLQDDPFDLVLMDLNMPVMDGRTAIKSIRQEELDKSSPQTPIVVLSADGQPETPDDLKELGADDFLTKPLDLDAVANRLSHYFVAHEDVVMKSSQS